LGFALSSLAPLALLVVFLAFKRSRRIARFGEQLPDVIDIVVRSLKAGHPLPVAISLVGREMPAPAGAEFMVVFEEISYGRELREALDGLSDRVGHDDLRFLITSIAIAHQTGGNLGEILARLSKLIRERFRMKRKIKALSAEGRAGGYVLSVVPFVIFGAVAGINPSYYGEFWGHPMQNQMLVVAIVLLLIGNFVIYRLVNFRV
jgi:tight adherence protein B